MDANSNEKVWIEYLDPVYDGSAQGNSDADAKNAKNPV